MVTVKEVFDYAVETDMSQLAHRVYWAISKNAVRLEDDCEKLNIVNANSHEVQELVEKNVLGIGNVSLFVIQTKKAGWFSFYLARNVLEAQQLHSELFREQGGKITRADRLMIPLMTFSDTGNEESLYDYRKRVVQYPIYVGHAKAGEHVLFRLEAGR